MALNNNPPRRPPGDDDDAMYYQWVWDQLVIYGQLIDTPEIKWERTTKGIIPKIKIHPPSSGGDILANPIIYDHTKSYKRSRLVFIPPDAEVVSTGFMDADAEEIVTARPGLWISTRRVAPVVVEEEDDTYHIPQWPLPTPNDPDAEDVYWMPVSLLCVE